MGRVVFINPFASTRISGGIKATYQHAELLTELGYQVTVFQPSGPPTWCSPHLRALVSDRLDPAAGDILVFPETLNGWLADYAKARNPATKIECRCRAVLHRHGEIPSARQDRANRHRPMEIPA